SPSSLVATPTRSGARSSLRRSARSYRCRSSSRSCQH
ncbi:MAG: hypothetical protein AVDCRST_MAG93-8353, partial [uncultured Chloroflexia bacterium]